ncbi:distal tail protein Dit [Gracilibacillus dipsosauri]|uniref:Siphovirus-type tail component RIFT-related domain-containing protein n=1 Tax=Gracilibacillus dipsosauri TaxID=178340 RepID=A0A317KXS1_9BACI|nr:distal tail protein Dit [Gracilibacillus dipsosauri]PWU68321.1 hypothetical protein DLJ74_07670 [Gracilibacillus dipsosauri]
MAYESITFNGMRKDWLYIERGRKKPPFAARRRNLLTVPGYPGGYLRSTDIEPLPIDQPVGFRIKDDADALAKKDELAEWLLTDKPVPLEFDDEPGRIYFAVVQNTLDDFEKMAVLRSGTIQFLCPDPYAYGPEMQFSAPSDYFNIRNDGTAEAEPVFELEVKEPVTFAMIQNQFNEYNMIGRPTEVDNTTYKKFERVFYSDGDTLNGWTTANAGEVYGDIMGQMAVGGNTRFQPSSYGSSTIGWHGPAIKTSLPEALQDFRMQTWISMYNKVSPNLLGKIELYLLDVNGNIVTRVGMMDGSAKMANMYGLARAYSGESYHTFIYEPGDQPGNWNDFAGVLRIQRSGNRWYAYFAKTDTTTGRHHTRRSVFWTDYHNIFTDRVAQIVVYIAGYKTYPTPNALGVYSLSVDKINQQAEGIPYIADVGDIITFDHTQNGQVYINGEPYEDNNLGADYFTLKKGDNQLVALPDSAFHISGKYRRRFL